MFPKIAYVEAGQTRPLGCSQFSMDFLCATEPSLVFVIAHLNELTAAATQGMGASGCGRQG